jgi:hypothetical protein
MYKGISGFPKLHGTVITVCHQQIAVRMMCYTNDIFLVCLLHPSIPTHPCLCQSINHGISTGLKDDGFKHLRMVQEHMQHVTSCDTEMHRANIGMCYSSPSIFTHRHEMFKFARLVTKAVNVSAHHPNPCQPSSLDIFISTENFPIPALPIRSPSPQMSMGLQRKLQNSSLKVSILSVPAKPKLT